MVKPIAIALLVMNQVIAIQNVRGARLAKYRKDLSNFSE